jgi:hypothetical protein
MVITAEAGMYRRDMHGNYHLVVLWDIDQYGDIIGVTVADLNRNPPKAWMDSGYTTLVPKDAKVIR